MKKTTELVMIAAAAAVFSTAAVAQSIPLNILVSGSTGGEIVQSQAVGTLSTTSTTTTSAASTAAAMIVSSGSSTSTN